MAEEKDTTKEEQTAMDIEEAPVAKVAAGNVLNQNITEELKQSYINYAMSVIVSRALPDVRDGLKPVQRRILYTMHKMNIQPGSMYKKVGRIVGEVMGKYHPHGDSSISDALVRLGQEFNTRYMLVDGQGNYGSIDGDPPAAMRYIEARLDKNGAAMLGDLDKRTVDFRPNYDGEEQEPEVLPGLLPNLLLNGTEGIAVGMATKIPPHNLNELVDATIHMIENENTWSKEEDEDFQEINYDEDIKKVDDLEQLPKNRFAKFRTGVELKELLKYIKGPDFPTGAEIYNAKDFNQMYETGKGRVLMRAVSHIEEMKGGKNRIIVTALPYQVNKARLIAKIADLYRDKKIDGITDLRDESNREGIRIVVELKRDAVPKVVENQLYKFTELQKAFNANILALVDGDPQVLTLKQILNHYVSHRQQIVIRRNEYALAKLREREHILEGLMIALDHIDEIIKTIRESSDAEAAKAALMKKFELSDIQAQAILDMQLRKLAALERQKIEDEYKEVLKNIKETLKLLNSPKEILEVIKGELSDLKEKLGDERKTKVHKGGVGEISEADLIENEEVFVTISEKGYIKRTTNDTYKSQKRGGVGVKAMTTKDGDQVRHVFKTQTHDQVLFFSNKGKVYSLNVYDIPEYGRNAKGIPVVNLIQVTPGELITSVLTRAEDGTLMDEDVAQEGEQKTEHEGKDYKYLFMATKKGIVKKTKIEDFDNIRANGLIAINLDDNDELIWVKPTVGDDHVIIVTKNAKSIHFLEDDVRDTGRVSRGVRGIKLKEDDYVISMDIVRNTEMFVLTVAENGYGKMTEIDKFNIQNRGGTGIFAARVTKKTGNLISSRILDHPKKELLILSKNGQAVRIPVQDLPVLNRQTSGVRLMKVKKDDSVAAIAIV
jgi:DNA gyrase subunit A